MGEPEQEQPDSWVPVSALSPFFAPLDESILAYISYGSREQMGEGRGPWDASQTNKGSEARGPAGPGPALPLWWEEEW